jgi:hypothetical protein
MSKKPRSTIRQSKVSKELQLEKKAHAKTLEALILARKCIAYCRRNHKDIQLGDGIPVEVFIDEAIEAAQVSHGE